MCHEGHKGLEGHEGQERHEGHDGHKEHEGHERPDMIFVKMFTIADF